MKTAKSPAFSYKALLKLFAGNYLGTLLKIPYSKSEWLALEERATCSQFTVMYKYRLLMEVSLKKVAYLFLLSLAPHSWSMGADYICSIQKVISSSGEIDKAGERAFVGSQFTVNRETGLMSGALKNSYFTAPQVIDFGAKGNGYKVITTMKVEQGFGAGSNIYVLNVKEYVEAAQKPFVFLQNETVYFGHCKHF